MATVGLGAAPSDGTGCAARGLLRCAQRTLKPMLARARIEHKLVRFTQAAHRPVTFATGPSAVGAVIAAVADGHWGRQNATPRGRHPYRTTGTIGWEKG